MRTKLKYGEVIIKEGVANLERNIESVGGKLYLTAKCLIFEPHRMNIQSGISVIDLSSVECTRNCRTRFLGFLPTFHNSLAVCTKEGKEFRFVLHNREEWAKIINETMNLN